MSELSSELGSLFHSICAEYELVPDPLISSLSHLSGYEQVYKELLSKALASIQEKKQLIVKQSKLFFSFPSLTLIFSNHAMLCRVIHVFFP